MNIKDVFLSFYVCFYLTSIANVKNEGINELKIKTWISLIKHLGSSFEIYSLLQQDVFLRDGANAEHLVVGLYCQAR